MRRGSVWSAAVFIVTRLYPLNKQHKRLLICNSRKMAKTDLYNERKREGRREEGVKGRKIERDRLFYDRAGLCRYCGAAFFYIVTRLYP